MFQHRLCHVGDAHLQNAARCILELSTPLLDLPRYGLEIQNCGRCAIRESECERCPKPLKEPEQVVGDEPRRLAKWRLHQHKANLLHGTVCRLVEPSIPSLCALLSAINRLSWHLCWDLRAIQAIVVRKPRVLKSIGSTDAQFGT